MSIGIIELELRNVGSSLLTALLAIALVTFIMYPLVASQSEAIQLNQAMQDIRRAESAGAEPGELQKLVDRMNYATQLQMEEQSLPAQDTDRKMKLQAEISSTLTSVDAEANQLEATAAERTYYGHLAAYSIALIGALIATAVYYYGLLFYKRYRVKRTFQMKIVPK